MANIAITLPANIRFAQLRLGRTPSGAIAFDWRPIERICAASGIDIALFRAADEDNVAGLIVGWYQVARAAGEPEDATAEELIAEVRAEERAGQHFSLPHGRA